MSRTHNSWSENGAGCSCTISTHCPVTFRELIEDDFEGAGTYNVGIQRETYQQEQFQFYASSVDELMNHIRRKICEIYAEVEFDDDLDFMEQVDFIEKVPDDNVKHVWEGENMPAHVESIKDWTLRVDDVNVSEMQELVEKLYRRTYGIKRELTEDEEDNVRYVARMATDSLMEIARNNGIEVWHPTADSYDF